MTFAWPHCPHCGREYRYDVRADEVPPICGEPYCRAMQDWTPEQWEGKARMARVRLAAGGCEHRTVPYFDFNGMGKITLRMPYRPDRWDAEALRRCES